MPAVVDAWRDELKSKGRPKIAGAIASPRDHPDLFEEGWAEALAGEGGAVDEEPLIELNGDAGESWQDV